MYDSSSLPFTSNHYGDKGSVYTELISQIMFHCLILVQWIAEMYLMKIYDNSVSFICESSLY